MSRLASNWAWSLNIKPASLKLLLLSMADRADEYHCCFPSILRLEKDTGLDRKTVLSGINKLIAFGVLADTGERKGTTKRTKVYKLIGIESGIETIDARGEKIIVPKTESFQKRNHSKNGTLNSPKNGTLNSPKNGTQNQSIEPVKESNKKNTKKESEILKLAEQELELAFDEFYQAGMRKVNRKSALKAFRTAYKKHKSRFCRPIDFAQHLARDIRLRNQNQQFGFNKLHPTTYLNNERWTDDHETNRPDQQHAHSLEIEESRLGWRDRSTLAMLREYGEAACISGGCSESDVRRLRKFVDSQDAAGFVVEGDYQILEAENQTSLGAECHGVQELPTNARTIR